MLTRRIRRKAIRHPICLFLFLPSLIFSSVCRFVMERGTLFHFLDVKQATLQIGKKPYGLGRCVTIHPLAGFSCRPFSSGVHVSYFYIDFFLSRTRVRYPVSLVSLRIPWGFVVNETLDTQTNTTRPHFLQPDISPSFQVRND